MYVLAGTLPSLFAECITQQALAQDGESEENINSFIARGKIDSVIYTVSGNWVATGDWILRVSDGQLETFSTDMNWSNKTVSHSHVFRNFEAEDGDIELAADESVSIEGNIDVGANRMTSWPGYLLRFSLTKVR